MTKTKLKKHPSQVNSVLPTPVHRLNRLSDLLNINHQFLAFTLIELLVVVAMLLPALARAREQAKEVKFWP